ncbi:MAG: hypothetical protein ACN6PN_04950 [Sphingobacterium sp.]
MQRKTESLIEPAILNDRTSKIFRYVEAYNQMDVENMIADFYDADELLN